MLKLISKHKWTIIGILVVVAAVAFFCRGYLSDPGIIGRHDWTHFYDKFGQGEIFGQWFQTWSSDEILSGPRDGICYELFSPLYFLIGKLHLLPTIPVSIWTFLIHLLAGISAFSFVYYYTRNIYASIAGGTLYSLNWTARSLLGGGTYMGIGFALFPILFLLFDRVLEKGRFRDIALFSIFAFIFITSSNYHPVYIAFFFLALYTLFHIFLSPGGNLLRTLFKTAKSSFFSLALVLGLLSYQLVPHFAGVSAVSLGVRYGAEEASALSSSMAVVLALEKGGHQPPAYGHPLFILTIVIAALAFSALLFRRDKYTIFFAIVALIGIFLAKGPHPPFAFAFDWLWDHFPAFSTFRDSGRWLMFTSLAYAFLLGVTIKHIQLKLKSLFQNKSPRGPTLLSIALVGTLMAMVLLSLKPLTATDFEKGYDPNNYPEYVEAEEAYDKIASQDEGIYSQYLIIRDYLVLDENMTHPQTGEPLPQTSNPVRWLYPDGGQPLTGLVRMDVELWKSQLGRFMQYHIDRLSMADFSQILGAENIKYVFVDKRMGQRYIDFFQNSDSFNTFYEGETLIVFENEEALPHLYAAPTSGELLGGLHSLLMLGKISDFSFSDINLLLPNSCQNADFLILYNADAEEFAMLSALESSGGVQSLNIDTSAKLAWWRRLIEEPLRYWVVTDWWTVRGDFVYGRLHLRTGAQAAIQIPFSVEETGDYEMWLRIAFALSRGELDAFVDGERLPGFPLTPEADFDYGFDFVKVPLCLEQGEHVLELRNDGSDYNDVDEVFLIKKEALDSLFSIASESAPAKVIYYPEAEVLFGLDELENWSIYSYVGHGEVIADENQSQFWYVLPHNQVSVSDNAGIKVVGEDSLEIEVTGERGAWTILRHRFSDPQDWSDYDCLSLYFYGKDTKTWFGIEAQTEDGELKSSGFGWQDNFVGWRQLVFPIDEEALDWSRVRRITIGKDWDAVSGTWYLDDLRVSKFTERPPVIVIKSQDETSPISANFSPLKEGEYMIAIRALATIPPMVPEYVDIRTIADDNQSQFWKVLLGLQDQVKLSNSTAIKFQGEDSLEIEVTESKAGPWTSFRHIYDTPQDWSDVDYISFHFYGNDTGQWFGFEVMDGEGEFQDFCWCDDFTGWKELTFLVDKQKLHWCWVDRVAIGMDKPAITDTWYLDDLTLGRIEMVPAGHTPEQTRLRLTVNGESIIFGNGGDENRFTTDLGWLEAGPIHLNAEPQTIELSNEGEVFIDKILLYPCESQSSLDSLFHIDNNVSLSYEKLSPTEYKIHVDAERPFWLVFAELYHPLWYAHVDGESIQSTQTYLDSYFAANSFYITKTGQYDIVLEFKGQQYLKYGAIISGMTLGFIFIGVIVSERRAKRKKRE